ncbi:EPIDERMAL PATTERNING FACTOR-like protein 1 [Euphorbia peplus]|nr:EPIDERMAL PATTERNING FACTOR-like protein 1 [Euphorbia peplus]
MEKLSKPNSLIILGLPFLLFSILSVNSRKLPPISPSPSPVGEEIIEKNLKMIKGREGEKGSNPAKCESKCNECNPCMAVQVAITTLDQLKENVNEFYYPQVWKCVCGDHFFSP